MAPLFGSSRESFVRSYFAGRQDSTPTTELRLVQREYMHDIAVVSVYGESMDSKRFHTGTPVEVQFGTRGRNTDVFYGYINHIEPDLEREKRNVKRTTKVICVGTSWVMKAPMENNYRGYTASSVIRRIAEDYKFTTDVDESDVVWQSLVSPGQTTWQFLNVLAHRMGFTLYCNKTEIRCLDQLAQLRQKGAAMHFVGPDSAPDGAVSISNFTAVSGETTPDGGERVTRVGHAVDPRTGSVLSLTNDMRDISQLGRESTAPFFEKVMTGLVFENLMEGKERLGAEARTNRFHIQAQATLLGNVKVHQGSVLLVTGVGDRHSGYWYVHEAEHELDYQHYVTKVTLGRDSLGLVGIERNQDDRRVIRERFDPFDSKVIVPPPTLLVNGQWRSAYAAKRQVV